MRDVRLWEEKGDGCRMLKGKGADDLVSCDRGCMDEKSPRRNSSRRCDCRKQEQPLAHFDSPVPDEEICSALSAFKRSGWGKRRGGVGREGRHGDRQEQEAGTGGRNGTGLKEKYFAIPDVSSLQVCCAISDHHDCRAACQLPDVLYGSFLPSLSGSPCLL
eukprot:766980-Hanusia_phi.AAC.5